LLQEAGGHRWQRVPKNERRGRVHTSTVTVAVFTGKASPIPELRESDLFVRITKGTGPGGQNRNKRETALVIRHQPTGIEVKAEAERTQEANRRVAMATLRERVDAYYARAAHDNVNQQRRAQAGSGQRGDKVRTYRSDGVTDHRTGRKASLEQIQAGRLDLLS
jgi:peptide chain release factor 1